MTNLQLEIRKETINTLIAVFGDADGKLAKELNEVYKQMEGLNKEEEMKQERMKQLIMDKMVVEATSPWDGEARFDRYSVIVHKYDNEDLAFIESNDHRFVHAVERIFQMVDPKEWDRLLEEGERNARPRGGRK